jgi:predicted dehydrogenase
VLNDPSIAVVAVDSGVKDHAADARAALLAGKHVHLEKPPANTMAELRELVALAERKKRIMQMGYMWRHHPGINTALEAARKGCLGDVYLVRGTINTILPPAGRQEVAMFPGGQMFELGGHLIDPLVRLLGKPEKVTSYLKHHGSAGDELKDNTVAVFEYPRALGLITSATLQPNAGAYRTFEILGSNGAAVVRPIEPPNLEIDLVKEAGPYVRGKQTVPMPRYQRYAADFEELAEAVSGNKPIAVTPVEDLMVQEALLAASDMLKRG